MDAAYDAAAIHDQSRALGHAPIVDRNFRADHEGKAEWGREVKRLKLIHMPDFDDLIYDFRTMAERVNARLKDEFDADFSASAAHSRSNAISCSASSRSPSIRSSVSSTTGPPCLTTRVHSRLAQEIHLAQGVLQEAPMSRTFATTSS